MTNDGHFSIEKGLVRLFLVRPWDNRGPVDALLKRARTPQGRHYWTFQAMHAPLLLPVLAAAGFRGLAEAIGAKVGSGVGEPDAADVLADLSSAKSPDEVQTPLGKAIVTDVEAVLAKRLPAGVKLHPYQTVGVAFARANGYRTLIADEMGLGKTPTSIAALAVDPDKLLPAVIVVPSIVFVHWQRELATWTPAIPVHLMPHRASKAPPAGYRGIVLTKTPLLTYQTAEITRFRPKLVIADEAQDYKNERSLQSRALASVARVADRAVFLSGTPFKNNLMELRTLLGMLDPSFGGKAEFGERYTEATDKETPRGPIRVYTGSRNVEELKARLARVMIRREKSQVAHWLPPKTHRYLPLDPEGPRLAEYRKAEAEFESWLRQSFDAGLRRELAAQPRLTPAQRTAMRASMEDRVLRALAAESLTKIGYLRQLAGRMKIRAAVRYLVTAAENQIPTLAFGWYQDVIHPILAGLKKAGVRAALVDGSLSSEEKQAVNDAFEAGRLDVVVGSKALAVGASYPRAQEVLFVERYWTPADESQAEDRAHRATTKHPILVSLLHLNGTVDDKIRSIIDRKRRLTTAVLGGGAVDFSETGSILDVLSDFLGARPQVDYEPPPEAPSRTTKQKKAVPRKAVVALSFAVKEWTPKAALQWAKISGWTPGKVRNVRGRLVVDVGPSVRGVQYRAVRLAPGVTAIVPVASAAASG